MVAKSPAKPRQGVGAEKQKAVPEEKPSGPPEHPEFGANVTRLMGATVVVEFRWQG